MKSILLFTFILFGCSSVTTLQGQSTDQMRSISLSETAYVEAKPDLVFIDVQIYLEGRDAAKIEEEAYEKSAELIKAFKEFGLEEEAYQTTENSMYDQRWREQDMKAIRFGYEVTFKELDKLESFRKAVIDAGATIFRISSYENSNAKSYTQKASEKALKAAMEQAKALAEVAGMQVGDPISMQVNSQYIRPNVAAGGDVMMMRAEVSDMQPKRESTSNKTVIRYKSTISVQFEIYKK